MNSKDIALIGATVILSAGAVILGVKIYDDHFSQPKSKRLEETSNLLQDQSYDITIDLRTLESVTPTIHEEPEIIRIKESKPKLRDKMTGRLSNAIADVIGKVPIKASIDITNGRLGDA